MDLLYKHESHSGQSIFLSFTSPAWPDFRHPRLWWLYREWEDFIDQCPREIHPCG